MSFEKARIKQLIYKEEIQLQIVENKRKRLLNTIKKLYEEYEKENDSK